MVLIMKCKICEIELYETSIGYIHPKNDCVVDDGVRVLEEEREEFVKLHQWSGRLESDIRIEILKHKFNLVANSERKIHEQYEREIDEKVIKFTDMLADRDDVISELKEKIDRIVRDLRLEIALNSISDLKIKKLENTRVKRLKRWVKRILRMKQ